MDLPPDLAQQTLDALTLNVAVLDATGKIIASNRAWKQFGQFNGIEGPADTIGENYLEVTEAADDEYAQAAAKGLQAVLHGDRDSFTLEYPCHSPTEKRWFLMHVSYFTTEDETYTVVAHENITGRKQAEQEVARRNEELEAFARLLSHDLRNPLNVAQGHAELLSDEVASESVETLQSALSRMGTLIEEALTVLQSETATLSRSPVSLRAIAEQSWETVETKDATLEVTGDKELEGDAGLLTNVFENLFRNAVEHGGSDITVVVGPLEDGFYVEDNGPGIPEADREDVFEIGFSSVADGTGFGLGIVRYIVEKHGWAITVKPGESGGARFEIYTQPAFPETEEVLSVPLDR